MSQTQTQTPEKTSISQKTNNKQNRKTPTVIRVSSSTLLFSLASFSLLCFSLFFLSFKDTTFWFFLSNSIILFVAAVDSDTFSPSKPKPDIYDDYMKALRSRNAYCHSYSAAAEPPSDSSSRGSRRDVVKDIIALPETEAIEEKRELECRDGADQIPGKTDTVSEKREVRCCSPVMEKPVQENYTRSVSAKAIVVVGGKKKKKKKALCRSETEIASHRSEEGDFSDFSAMSDEELNRRVEEFIRRFNRQIRLQEMRDQTENS